MDAPLIGFKVELEKSLGESGVIKLSVDLGSNSEGSCKVKQG